MPGIILIDMPRNGESVLGIVSGNIVELNNPPPKSAADFEGGQGGDVIIPYDGNAIN